MDTHFVEMSTGNKYPCDCSSKGDHKYSSTSMADIIKQLAADAAEE